LKNGKKNPKYYSLCEKIRMYVELRIKNPCSAVGAILKKKSAETIGERMSLLRSHLRKTSHVQVPTDNL